MSMDPISAAASVAGVLTIVVQTIVITKQFIDGVKRASRTILAFLEELVILSSSLGNLEMLVEKNHGPNNFTQTSSLLSQTKIIQKNLKDLNQKLDRIGSNRLQRATWPLSEREHRQSIEDLRAFSQWIQLSLSMDSAVLLTKSHEEIVSILSKQIESLKELNVIGDRAASIQASVDKQGTLLQDIHEKQEKQRFFSWLSAYDEQAKHFAVKGSRIEGTGQWFLESSEFQQWMLGASSDNILLCRGNPGVGKSVLASLAIDHVKENTKLTPERIGVAYLYFEQNHRDMLTPSAVCGSLAKQLLMPQQLIPWDIWDHFKISKDTRRADLPTARAVLLNAFTVYRKSYIIIDALDEYNESRFGKPILEILETIKSRSDVQLLVTSRKHCSAIDKVLSGRLQLEISAKEQDLKRYLNSRFERASVIDEEFKDVVIDKIVGKAKHMFLLAALQVQAVIDAPSIGEMEEACELLPTTLDEAFGDTVSRIKALPPAKEQLAMKSLMWIACLPAGHSLRMTDLKQALAVRQGQKSTNPRFRPTTEMIIDCCRGLIVQDEGTERVQFSHLAVQDYLQARAETLFPGAHELIFKTCLEFLNTEVAVEFEFVDEDKLQRTIQDTPLLSYVVANWGYHYSRTSSEELTDNAIRFLGIQTRKNSMCQIAQYLLGRNELYWDIEEADSNNMLHVAASFGLERVAQKVLQLESINTNSTTSLGTTALMQAASGGHIGIIHLLLSKGADPGIMNWYGNSLHCAAEAGRVESIEVLLLHERSHRIGRNWIEQENSHGVSALECAYEGRHQAAMETLIRYNPTPSSLFDQYICDEYMKLQLKD